MLSRRGDCFAPSLLCIKRSSKYIVSTSLFACSFASLLESESLLLIHTLPSLSRRQAVPSSRNQVFWKAVQSMHASKANRGRKNLLLVHFPSFPPPRSRPIRENPLSRYMLPRQFPYLVPLFSMIWKRGRRRVFRQLN